MAMIQKIRDNSALTLIVIGGAIFAFILTDFLSSRRGSSEIDDMVGAFDGIEISDREFSAEREKLVFLSNGGQSFSATQEFQKGQFTNQAWNSLLRDKFYANECEELGFKVTREEEEEMLIGNQEKGAQPSAFYVNYLFGGPEYYQKNHAEIAQNTADLSKHAYMAVFNRERQIVDRVPLGSGFLWVRDFGLKLRQQDKLQRVLSNCFYTTTSLAKNEYVANNSKKDVEVAFVKYNSLNDESVNPTEAEIKAAYEEIKFQFVEKEASRKLLYAKFDLLPSAEDKNNVLRDVANLKMALNEESDASLFIKNETEGIVDFTYYKKGEYPEKIAGLDTVLFGLNKGATYGPFTNPAQSKYGVAKVLDVRNLADSAKFELAFVKVQPVFDRISAGDSSYQYSQDDQPKVQKLYGELVDSLLDEAKTKAFTNLSDELVSVDSTYIKDGELQWVQLTANGLGQNFMDTIVTCNVGDIKKVFIPTQQGGIYGIVKVLEFGAKSPKMKIGSIIKNVTPGDNTLEDYMSKANQVAFAIKDGKGISSLTDSLSYVVDSVDAKGSTYSLRGISDSRKVIYWAFNSEFNQPSNVFTTPSTYVVAVVKGESNDKFKSLDNPSVKYACEAHARKAKQKAKILESFPALTAENLNTLPTLYTGGLVNQESGVNLKRGASKFSREFEVNGVIAGLAEGKVSDQIEGEEGVYVVKVNKATVAEVTEDTSFDIEKSQLQGAAQRNSNLLIDEYITEKSDLTDNRKILR